MLQQPAEAVALGAADSAVTAEISRDRSVGTAHCRDYMYYRQTWQLRSVNHLGVVSHLASFSGVNLLDLSGGSTLWFFRRCTLPPGNPELPSVCLLRLMWAHHSVLRPVLAGRSPFVQPGDDSSPQYFICFHCHCDGSMIVGQYQLVTKKKLNKRSQQLCCG